MFASLAVGFVAFGGLPAPPYRRVETRLVFKQSYDPAYAVSGDRFVAASHGECAAFSLKSLKPVWSIKLPKVQGGEGIVVQGNTVSVSTSPYDRKSSSSVLAFDLATGKALWKVVKTSRGGPMTATKETLYVSLKPNTVSAFDLKKRRVKWTCASDPLTKGSFNLNDPEALSFAEGVVLYNNDNTTYAVDAATGKRIWKQPKSYMLAGALPTANGVAWVPADNGSIARELRTGKVLWQKAKEGLGDYGVAFAGQFVGLDEGKALAFDPKTGRRLWAHPIGPDSTSGGNIGGAVLGDRLFARGLSKAIVVDPTGKKLWEGNEDEGIAGPVWTDGQSIVGFDGQRLRKYVHGSLPPLPSSTSDRARLAGDLIGRYDDLDGAETNRIVALGDAAFPSLLEAFLKTCADHDALGEKGDSYPLYSRFHDLGDLLAKVSSAKRGDDLKAAMEKLGSKSSARPMVMGLLTRFGDAKDNVAAFLQVLEKKKTPGFELYESDTYVAREYIKRSTDPRAVDFMIRQLQEPKADETLRFEAYLHLAGTGGERGRQAVLAERHRRQLLRPLAERVISGYLDAGEFGKQMKPEAEKTGPDGRSWGLLTSGVLGSHGDLFWAEKKGGGWANPIFLGVSKEGVSRWVNPPPPEPTVAGKTAKQLLASDWLELVLAHPELAKDGDGDGLTDLVESRLGTDPAKADTDGDGDPDGVDPWPNAKPRELSDEEKILAALFEARFHFQDSEGAALMFAPEGLPSFEMPGRKGPTLWLQLKGKRDFGTPLERCYEQGVAFITFDSSGGGNKPVWPKDYFRWNGAKTEAGVGIAIYYGGLNGTGYSAVVRKFGSEWIVVSMQMSYIS